MAQIVIRITSDAKEANKTITDLETRLKALSSKPINIKLGISEKEVTLLSRLTTEQMQYAMAVEKTKQARASARAEQAKADRASVEAEARIRAETEATNRSIEATKRQAEMNKRAAEATVQSENKRATAVAKMGTEIAKAAQEETKLAREREKAARAAEDHGRATENESKAINNLGSNLKGSFEKMATTLGSTIRNRISSAITSAITSATRQAITTMKEVDTQLTNIQKVSQISNEERQRIGASAFSTASKYGVSADDYLSAVYTFKKAGINESAEAMAELATKTMLVGDTTATVASKFLIAANAAWKYNGDITALSKVVDEADWINNNYATDLAKLSAGMPVVASTAANMGMTLEETMAVLGTITAVTQESGTKAATAWRALSMNLAKEIGTFLTEDGDEIEVTADSIKSVTDALYKYAPAVVEAAKASGKMIDPIKAIEGLSKAYKDGLLTDVELTNILMSVGGKLRTNQLTALVKNFDMYKKMLGELEHSAGTADKEIDTMMGSWERKAQVLKNTWTEFISHLVSSDMFKDLISGVTTLVEWLDKGSGSLMAVAAAAGAAALAFCPLGAVIGGAAAALVLWIGNVRNANEEYKLATEALDKMNETFETQNEHLKENDDKIEATARITQAYIDKLAKLDRGSDEYHDTLLRITELMPELKNYIDLENDTIDGGIDLLHKRADAWVENAKMAAYGASVEAKAAALANAEIAKAEAELKQSRAETELNTYNKRMQSLVEAIEFNTQKRDSTSDATEMEMYARMGVVLDEELAKVRILRDEAAASYKAQTEAIEGYDEAILTATQDLEDAEKAYDSLAQKADKMNKANSGDALRALGAGGSVDLTNRPVIDAKELAAKGWADAGEGAATVFSETFSNKAGDLAVNLTPILYDPSTGEHKVLTHEELAKYAEGLLKGIEGGKKDDYAKLQIGAEFTGEDAIKQAEEAAQQIHELQEEYFAVDIAKVEEQGAASAKDAAKDITSANTEVVNSEEEAAAGIEFHQERRQKAYSDARHQVKGELDGMVDDIEKHVEDVGDTIESETPSVVSTAASAGAEIGLSFAKSIAQTDAVKDAIAQMVGAAKEFMRSLGGSFSIHPSGANYYYERGTGNKVYYKAAGTTNAEGGPTLVNELGPELINDNGKVYIANGGKPGVVNLSRGAIVLTAEQTAGALKGSGVVPRRGLATGAAPKGYDQTLWNLGYGEKAAPVKKSWIDSVYDLLHIDAEDPSPTVKVRGGGGSSTPGKTAAQIAKEAAEKRKKELEAAQKKLDDSLSNLDKQIKLALNKGDEKKAAQLYEKQQQLISDMVKKYQKAGYKDTSNEILDLLNKNYDIAGKQESLYKDKFDDLIDSLDANTDAEKKANTLAEKAQAVSDAQEALANAQKQRTVRIYNAATGQWEWIADEKQVKSAEENLKKAEESYADEVKSQALEELKSMRDTISNLNDIVLGPALSTVATMGSDTSEFQAFAQALHAVYGVGSYLVGTEGSKKVLPTNDSHDTVYSFGDLVLTEEQASTMTLKQLAQQLQVLKLTS